MMHSRLFHPVFVLLACLPILSVYAAAPSKINLPPPAELIYSIQAKQSGIAVNGEAILKWLAGDGRYALSTETSAMLIGKILETRSEGSVDPYGLAPARFSETRFRKEPVITTFDRADKTIRFTESAQTYPIKGGEQDRSSVIWQLISMARANPAGFKSRTEWRFFVAGRRDAEPWIFKLVNQEKIQTAQGEVNAWHIKRLAPPDAKAQQLDIWLAPTYEWYPARLRFSEGNGDFIEQSLAKISKQAR